MSPAEAMRLLLAASTFDGRLVTEEAANSWAEILGAVPVDAALVAVSEHYRAETRRVMPADILRSCIVERDPWTRR